MDAYAALSAVHADLDQIAGVTTCRIGLEPDIAPEDYPIIRIVPVRIEKGGHNSRRSAAITVYVAVDVDAFESGMGAVYDALLDLEAQILERMRGGGGWRAAHVDTLFDDQVREHYQVMACRFSLEWML